MAQTKKLCLKTFLQLKVFNHLKTSEIKSKNMKKEFKQDVTQNIKNDGIISVDGKEAIQ